MVKDYDLGINYHSGKANVVADALSRKPVNLNVISKSLPPKLQEEIAQLNLVIVDAGLANILEVTPTLEEEIRKAQPAVIKLQRRAKSLMAGQTPDFSKDKFSTVRFREWICVPNQPDLKKKILSDAHESSYSIHLGGMKMYEDLRQIFWWDGMKKDIAFFVACRDICNKVKADHQKPTGLLQPLPVSQWKWDDVCMDFITGLPRTQRGKDAIWVIIDTLTKVAHFIPISTRYRADELAQL